MLLPYHNVHLYHILVILCAYVTSVLSYEISLDSDSKNVVWTLENKNKSIITVASVPGGVYSDLYDAGIIGDILWRDNDILTRWIAYDTWTYTAKFNVTPKRVMCDVVNLVLEGVDTFAHLELNGVPIGSTQNMFVRYVFNVKQHLKKGENELKIWFDSSVHVAAGLSDKHFAAPACVPAEYRGECHANQIRKMQASFSWDWGPAFPSAGIWKPMFIEFADAPVIAGLTTHTHKSDATWMLQMIVYMKVYQMKHIRGFLKAVLELKDRKIQIERYLDSETKQDGAVDVRVNMTISENIISPWWPNGYGEQTLYDLVVWFTPSGAGYDAGKVSRKHVRVGFRTLELVEEDASKILGNNTAGAGLTFYFKVNGYPIFMKGSNWIPSHILPEHTQNISTINSLLEDARAVHMNMVRVWGGGVYETDHFYSRCDELGLLVWQDLPFACSMYPAIPEYLDNVRTEIEQNVMRLQHHPSIAVWGGNNENEVALRGNWYDTQPLFEQYKREYVTLYVQTIKPIVEALDPGRRYLVSSPSNGLKSEQDGYIASNPYDPNYGDTHYYNYFADGWDMNIYPNTRFASEYGFQSLPSLRTMRSATNIPEDYALDSKYSKHRQHSPNGYSYIENQINRNLRLSKNDTKYFEKFVYYSQISQAMSIKAESEFYRQSQSSWYTMGALYWQLNDVWQAPSWSGIEYGGKWKMLHYFAKSFFAPVLVSPRKTITGDVDVYLINDRFVPIEGAIITIDVFNWSSLIPVRSHSYGANVDALKAEKQLSVDLWDEDNKNEIFMRFSLDTDGVVSSPYNYVFPVPLKIIKGLMRPTIEFQVKDNKKVVNDKNEFTVCIKVDAVVLYLWLETDVEGQFEENGVIVTEANVKTYFYTKENISEKYLERSITYQYYENE